MTDASGAINEQTAYDSFGNATNNLSTRYQFTGREFDNFTGLHYYRARFYDSQVGRFISEDPIGFAGGDINLYGYVQNRPVSLKDPNGTFPLLPVGVLGGLAAIEGGIHLYLSDEATSIKWNSGDPYGRKKHCYVNCRSVRLHLGNSAQATAAGLAQEGVNLLQYSLNGNLSSGFYESLGDLRANEKGLAAGYLFWKDCEKLCENCQ